MKKTLITLICILLINTLCMATELDDIIKNLQKSEKTIEDIHIELTQKINFVTLKETHTITAELFFKKPGKLHYTIKGPSEQHFISDGKKLWIYTPQNKQVLVDFWKNWKGISYFIPGMFNPKGRVTDLKKIYDFTLKAEDENAYLLLLKPRQKVTAGLGIPPESFEFYLWLSKKDYHPVKSRFESKDITGETEILIYETNLKIPDEKFTFKVPEGVEVLNLFR
ncbi:MAG: outer-membrane lipoprotein carrier protein LolA [Elusimicrobiota bacterium]